jgi:Asp-tRNA(Asn)/Glu-tRNA(Gln) amidotransferase A subunit family amidase
VVDAALEDVEEPFHPAVGVVADPAVRIEAAVVHGHQRPERLDRDEGADRFINYSGHPAASIPAGLADNGLPVGMQIIGKRYADSDVLAASAVFERMRPWQKTYEKVADRAT